MQAKTSGLTMLEQVLHGSDMNRRQWALATAYSFLGVRVGSASEQPGSETSVSPSATSVIYLYMNGGMSQLDTFDVKPGSSTQGPVESIKTNVAGLNVSQHFPLLAQQMHHVAVVRSMTTTQGAHRQARHFLRTSYPISATERHPSLASWITHATQHPSASLPANIVISPGSDYPGAGFLDARHAALAVPEPQLGVPHLRRHEALSKSEFDARFALSKLARQKFESKFPSARVSSYSGLYDEAVQAMHCRDIDAFDISREPKTIRDDYGDSRFGQGCLLARRLVERGVRFVEVVKPGWDTHNYNFRQLDELGPDLDRAISALLIELSNRGLLKSTLVVLATEFGRTPQISNTLGRGHHVSAFTFLLAGGGIAGGNVYGQTDKSGQEVMRDPVSIPDINATIAAALGISPATKHVDPSRNREYFLADDGEPVSALFG